jgi:hypothetical protein
MPVAGTIIHTSGLSGNWLVRLLVDGQYVTGTSFDLAP